MGHLKSLMYATEDITEEKMGNEMHTAEAIRQPPDANGDHGFGDPNCV